MSGRSSSWLTRLCAIAAVMLSAPAVSAEDNRNIVDRSGVDPRITCDTAHEGKLIFKGRNHREYSGEIYYFMRPEHPQNFDAALKLRKRFVLIKNSNCGIEFFAITGPESYRPNIRATGSFLEALQGEVPNQGLNTLLGSFFGDKIIIKVSDAARQCSKLFDTQRLAVIKRYGNIGYEIDGYLVEEQKALNKCLLLEARRLDREGFLGVYVASSRAEMVFTYLNGNLEFWSKE